MIREDLIRAGNILKVGETAVGHHKKCFYPVSYQGRVVGVGLFHDNNQLCTLALVVDENGSTLILGHFSEEHLVEKFDIARLTILFDKLYISNL